MDMAKNVTFANVLLLASMLKISIKFNILTCLVPYDPFHMGRNPNSIASKSFGNS